MYDGISVTCAASFGFTETFPSLYHDEYSSLILSEKLYPHLLEIDRAARERMDAMLPRMMEAAGVTEELKARDPMRWVGLMNTLKAQAEEIIFQELISA